MNEIVWGPGMTLAEVEKLVILKAYSFFRHNKTTTANALGISTKTLDSKLEQYDRETGLQREREAYELRKRTEFLARSRGMSPDNLNGAFTPAIAKTPPSASTGVRMESITNSSEKHALPMQERKEVQKVLSTDTSKSSTKRKS